MPREQLVAKLEALALPFAPIARPDELSDDPHLLQSGGLVEVTIAGDEKTLLPGLPIGIDGQRMHPRHDIPTIGQDAADILNELRDASDRGTAWLPRIPPQRSETPMTAPNVYGPGSTRSEERRVGTRWGRTCRTRGSPEP